MSTKMKSSPKHIDNFQLASNHFNNGNVNQARKILEEIVSKNKTDFDALNFLGGIHLTLGDYERSADYFQKVVSIYKPHPTAHYNLGLSYQGLAQFDKAEESYKNALALNPGNIDVINNLGVVCYKQGKNEDALEFYKKVLSIDGNNPKILNNVGNLESSKGNLNAAEGYYKKALENDSNNCSYLFNLADCYSKQNRLEESVQLLNKITRIDPNNYQAYNSLGVIHMKLNKYDIADELFNKSLKLKEDFWEAYQNLGHCYEKKNLSTEAVKVYKKAIELNKDNNLSAIKVSNILMGEGNYEESEKYLTNLKENGNNEAKMISYANLGVSKLKQGKVEDSLMYTKMAIAENDQVAITHYNFSHALLMIGQFSEGWKEYEWRKQLDDFKLRKFSKPELSDLSVEGKKILVIPEQGIGDTLQFIRYLPLLKEKGAHVIFECESRLSGLLKNCEGYDEIIIKTTQDEPEIDYDYYVYLLSLPKLFDTNLENIPAKIPYISIDEEKIEKCRTIMNGEGFLKVGLVWGGNPNHKNDARRSTNFSSIAKLLDVPGVKFYSLQRGKPAEQIKEYKSDNLIDIESQFNSIDESTAAIMNMDLVISVDTSIAHLAGSLGKEVWIMLSLIPDWRWMLDKNDTPWYPTARLFRQKEERNWETVVDEIYCELKKRADAKLAGQKNEPQSNEPVNTSNGATLYMGLASGSNFGWGVVCSQMKKELIKMIDIHDIAEKGQPRGGELAKSKFFQLLVDLDFNPLYNLRGKENYGYSVFENELNEKSVENSKKYDKVIVASTWCKEKLEANGISNNGLIIQGIDPELFYPVPERKKDNLFVIFSGGKMELRKGQDLVLKAFQILHKKYPDMILVNAWYNFWPQTMASMARSKHINFEFKGNDWHEFVTNLLVINDIDPQKVFILPITPNEKLRELYAKTDVGLFPNRCEGGTNLVLMEYMACRKPVIASFNTGHKDVLNVGNSMMLKDMTKFELHENNRLVADWEEASIDEIVASVEVAYQNREMCRILGGQAARDMKKFTWEQTAQTTINELGL